MATDALAIAATQWGYEDRVDLLSAPTSVQLWKADSRRYSLMFSNAGPDSVLIAFRPVINTQGAVIIWPFDVTTILTFRDLGPIVQQQVFAISSGTAGNATLNSFQVYRITKE